VEILTFFQGNFHRAVSHLKQNNCVYEGVDLVAFGGRIGPQIFSIIKEWWGSKMPYQEKVVFDYLMDDCINSVFMVPKSLGGGAYKTRSGWKDGPYGTTYFDAISMYIGYLYIVFHRLSNIEISSSIIMNYGTKWGLAQHLKAEIHGDNYLATYPRDLAFLLSFNDAQTPLLHLGWEIKEITMGPPEASELMGFPIFPINIHGARIFVGKRPIQKVLRSLFLRRKHYSDPDQDLEYLRQIIACLMITDAYSDAYTFLCYLNSYYGSPKQDAYEDRDAETLAAYNEIKVRGITPREFWLPARYRDSPEVLSLKPSKNRKAPYKEITDEQL